MRDRGTGDWMRSKRVTLADGRYLIFYSFEDEVVSPSSEETEAAAKAEPCQQQPKAQAEEEERSV